MPATLNPSSRIPGSNTRPTLWPPPADRSVASVGDRPGHARMRFTWKTNPAPNGPGLTEIQTIGTTIGLGVALPKSRPVALKSCTHPCLACTGLSSCPTLTLLRETSGSLKSPSYARIARAKRTSAKIYIDRQLKF